MLATVVNDVVNASWMIKILIISKMWSYVKCYDSNPSEPDELSCWILKALLVEGYILNALSYVSCNAYMCIYTKFILSLAGVYTQEFNFCERVMEKLHPETYREFLNCLHIYSKEIITRTKPKNLARFWSLIFHVNSRFFLKKLLIN